MFKFIKWKIFLPKKKKNKNRLRKKDGPDCEWDDSSYATTTRLSLHAQLDGVPTCAALSNAGIVMKKRKKKKNDDDDDEGVSSWLQRFKRWENEMETRGGC